MDNFLFQTQGTATYLVYKLNREDIIDAVDYGMMDTNSIPGLLPFIFTQMDDEKYLKYNVTSKISLSQFFSTEVKQNQLLGVFSSMIAAFIEAEEYMIKTGYLLLDTKYIFVDITKNEAYLICLPVKNSINASVDLNLFFKNIIFNTRFDQSANCDYVAKILNYLNSSSVFSLKDLKKVIDDISSLPRGIPLKPDSIKEYDDSGLLKPLIDDDIILPKSLSAVNNKRKFVISESIKSPNPKDKKVKDNKGLLSKLNLSSKPKKKEKSDNKASFEFDVPFKDALNKDIKQADPEQNKQPVKISTRQSGNYGNTILFEDESNSGTVLLGQESKKNTKPFLVRKKNNERIYISSGNFRIGREKSIVDYCIPNVSTLGRLHATIVIRDGKYYIIDANSKNHTYIDGNMIPGSVESELKHGSRIRLAEEEFEFYLNQ